MESMEGDEGGSDKDRYVQTCGRGRVKVTNAFRFGRCILYYEDITRAAFFLHLLPLMTVESSDQLESQEGWRNVINITTFEY